MAGQPTEDGAQALTYAATSLNMTGARRRAQIHPDALIFTSAARSC